MMLAAWNEGITSCPVSMHDRECAARATIAMQLYNAKEPLTLFELQAWLGHRSPSSTQHYAQLTPTKLARAYADAEYFTRNVRTMTVLLDQDALRDGAAARGETWKLYDLGHGYCSYDFFDQCPHRMACAKCAFYIPKGSSRAQAVEGKANLLRMLQERSPSRTRSVRQWKTARRPSIGCWRGSPTCRRPKAPRHVSSDEDETLPPGRSPGLRLGLRTPDTNEAWLRYDRAARHIIEVVLADQGAQGRFDEGWPLIVQSHHEHSRVLARRVAANVGSLTGCL